MEENELKKDKDARYQSDKRSPDVAMRAGLGINESVLAESQIEAADRGSFSGQSDQRQSEPSRMDLSRSDDDIKVQKVWDRERVPNDDIVVEESNEDKSSGERSNHTMLSHRRILDSRNQSMLAGGNPMSYENLGGFIPSDVSVAESELKKSVFLLSQKQRELGDNAQATTVMQHKMAMMPQKHRNMLIKQSQQKAGMDTNDISLVQIDQYLMDQAFQMVDPYNRPHRNSMESIAMFKNRKSHGTMTMKKANNQQFNKEFSYLSDLTIM